MENNKQLDSLKDALKAALINAMKEQGKVGEHKVEEREVHPLEMLANLAQFKPDNIQVIKLDKTKEDIKEFIDKLQGGQATLGPCTGCDGCDEDCCDDSDEEEGPLVYICGEYEDYMIDQIEDSSDFLAIEEGEIVEYSMTPGEFYNNKLETIDMCDAMIVVIGEEFDLVPFMANAMYAAAQGMPVYVLTTGMFHPEFYNVARLFSSNLDDIIDVMDMDFNQ